MAKNQVAPETVPLRISDFKAKDNRHITLLHLSDLHFEAGSYNPPHKIASYITHALDSIRDSNVDLIAVTGDLIDNMALKADPRKRALNEAHEFLKFLCKECNVDPQEGLMVIPGNHDYRLSGMFGSKVCKEQFDDTFGDYFAHRLYPEKGLFFACFDSNGTTRPLELAMGNLDIADFHHLRARVAAAGLTMHDLPLMRVALVHHHPLPVPLSEGLPGLVGGPEFMILKNAGVFLHRLMKDEFRLVLHGHWHYRNLWRLSSKIEQRERWLEVLSNGSFGKPPDAKHSFNIIRFKRDGYVTGWHQDFTAAGVIPQPDPIKFAVYDDIRTTASKAANGAAAANGPPLRLDFSSELRHQIWEVTLPEGDVVVTDILRGLQSTSNSKSVQSIDMFSTTSALTTEYCEAFSFSTDQVVQSSRGQLTGNGGIKYDLVFHPPLAQQPRDIVYQNQTFGAIFTSVDDQKRWGLPESLLEKENVGLPIRFSCQRLIVTLKFIGPQPPTRIWVEVKDADGNLVESETLSTHFSFNYWSVKQLPADIELKIEPSAEAVLSVHKPRLGFAYTLNWELPQVEPISAREQLELNGIQQHLRQIGANEEQKRAVQAFLQKCMSLVPAAQNDADLHACLFVANEDGTQLQCVATSAGAAALSRTKVKWGRDIIGTALRRGSQVYYERRAPNEIFQQTNEIPADLEFLLAYPVYCYEADGYPSAVVALASSNLNSGLKTIIHDDGTEEQIHTLLWKQWLEDFKGILGPTYKRINP